MMPGKTTFVVYLLFAFTQKAEARCILLDMETCNNVQEARSGGSVDVESNYNSEVQFLHLDGDSNQYLPAGSPYLFVSPQDIFLGQTKSLTVNCTFSLADVSNMTSLTSLIVSKSVVKDNQLGQYQDLVSIDVSTPDRVMTLPHLGASVRGLFESKGQSFLTLEWSNPTEEQAGLFRCEAHGLIDTGRPFGMFNTRLVMSKQPDLEWLVDKVNQLQNHIEDKANITLSHLQNQEDLIKNQSDHITMMQSKLEIQEELLKNQSNQITMMQSTLEIHEINKHKYVLKAEFAKLFSQSRKIEHIKNTMFSKLIMSEEYTGHYYLLFNDDWKTASEAIKACQDLGAYLVQINDESENKFLKNFLDQQPQDLSHILVDGTDEEDEGRWILIGTNTTLVHTDWATDEPDDNLEFNCIVMSKNNQWLWKDHECKHSYSESHRFLCEVEEW